MLFTFLTLIFLYPNWKCITNTGRTFDFARRRDTLFVATNGGIRAFSINDIDIENDTFKVKNEKIFTSCDGLPRNIVPQVEVDPSGGIWCYVKDKGMYVKPPGDNEFHNYSLPFESLRKISTFKITDDFWILVGTDDGLFAINTFGDYEESDDYVIPPIEIQDTVKSIYLLSDTAYISTYNKVYTWVQGVIREFPIPLYYGTLSAFARSSSSFAYGSGEYLVVVFSDTVCTYYTDQIFQITYEGDTIYIASVSGLLRLNNYSLDTILNFRTTSFTLLDSLILAGSYFPFLSSYETGTGLILLKNGNIFFEKQSSYFNRYTSLKIDDNGYIWGGILSWYENKTFLPSKMVYVKNDSVFTVDSLYQRDRAVRTISIDSNGKIWCGTYSDNPQGIFIYDSTGNFIERITNLPSPIVCHIHTGKDTLVALFLDGIYRLRRSQDTYAYSLIYSVDYPTWVEPDNNEQIWIGTENNGVLVVDSTGNLLLHLTESDFGTPLVNVIKHHNENTYIGTGTGFFKYTDGVLKQVCIGHTRDIEFYKNYVWILQDSSLKLIDEKTDEILRSYTEDNSPFIPIYSAFYKIRDVLEVDRNGNLWFGGNEGLFYFEPEYPLPVSDENIFIYPNPVKRGGIVQIKNTDKEPIVLTLDLKKVNARIEMTQDGFILNTGKLESGLYIIHVPGKKPAKLVVK